MSLLYRPSRVDENTRVWIVDPCATNKLCTFTVTKLDDDHGHSNIRYRKRNNYLS